MFCLFLERIDSHCVCFEDKQIGFCFRLRSSVFRREFAEFSKALDLRKFERVSLSKSSSGGRSLPVNLLGNGSGGASSSGQASACAGEERPSLFSDSGNSLSHFNPFAAAFAFLGPAERFEAEFMGLLNF